MAKASRIQANPKWGVVLAGKAEDYDIVSPV